MRRCAEEAQTVGVELYVENMPAVSLAEGMKPMGFSYGVRYEELRQIFERVGHPSLRLCLDLGHGYLAGMDYLRALLRERDVVHVHVNDGLGWHVEILPFSVTRIEPKVTIKKQRI